MFNLAISHSKPDEIKESENWWKYEINFILISSLLHYNPSNEEPYKCHSCDKSFYENYNSETIWKHILYKYSTTRIAFCPI